MSLEVIAHAESKDRPIDTLQAPAGFHAPALLERIIKYCQAEERSISWVVQKAVDVWLKERGF